MCASTILSLNCKQMLKRYAFKQLFCEKIWFVSQKAIPLHPLSRTNDTMKLTPIESVREGSDKERVL